MSGLSAARLGLHFPVNFVHIQFVSERREMASVTVKTVSRLQTDAQSLATLARNTLEQALGRVGFPLLRFGKLINASID